MSEKLNILLVSQAFYPENSPRSFRATELAKEFSKQGHRVTVLTTPKTNALIEFSQTHHFNLKYTNKVDISEINWNSKYKPVFLLNRLIIRLSILLFEYPSIKLTFVFAKALKKEKNKYDLLISFAVPYTVHWGVALVWNKYKPAKKWIADCGDPYYLEKLDSFRKLFYFAWVEKWMFKKVDKIALTRYDFKVNYFPEFHPKIVEIPQGFDFNEFGNIEQHYTVNNIPTFAFAGSMSAKYRQPDAFMHSLLKYSGDFRFYVYTSTPQHVLKYKELLKEKLVIKTYITRVELIPILAQMDFLVNLEFNPLVQSPSKLIDYAIAKRPILNFNQSTKKQDEEVLFQFLVRNYQNAFVIDNIEKYQIENVSKAFIKQALN